MGLFNREIGDDQTSVHKRVLCQHQQIVEAIVSGNAARATECLTEHLLQQKSLPKK